MDGTEFFNTLLQANKGLALATVLIVQCLKVFLPPDPSAPSGKGRFTVAPRFRRYLLPATFVIGVVLSYLLDPHDGQSVQGKVTDGLQTGAYAVVAWEIYSNWIRPIVQREGGGE